MARTKNKVPLNNNLGLENWEDLDDFIAQLTTDEIRELAASLKSETW